MEITRYSQAGQKELVQVKLPHQIKIEPTLVTQIVVSEAANLRAPHAHTKTRAEVSGGGRKPWRQKGTGRARAGSIRSPLWVGGGITFGPRPNRNFRKRTTRMMRSRAFTMSLVSQLQAGRLVIVDPEVLAAEKTKTVANYLSHIEDLGRRPLIILSSSNEPIRGFRNLAGLRIGTADSVTTTEILAATKILVTPESLNRLGERAFGTELVSSAPSPKPAAEEKKSTKENQ